MFHECSFGLEVLANHHQAHKTTLEYTCNLYQSVISVGARAPECWSVGRRLREGNGFSFFPSIHYSVTNLHTFSPSFSLHPSPPHSFIRSPVQWLLGICWSPGDVDGIPTGNVPSEPRSCVLSRSRVSSWLWQRRHWSMSFSFSFNGKEAAKRQLQMEGTKDRNQSALSLVITDGVRWKEVDIKWKNEVTVFYTSWSGDSLDNVDQDVSFVYSLLL